MIRHIEVYISPLPQLVARRYGTLNGDVSELEARANAHPEDPNLQYIFLQSIISQDPRYVFAVLFIQYYKMLLGIAYKIQGPIKHNQVPIKL